MFGFQPKSKQGNQPEPAQPKLGLIKGKGTGTSDSIKTDVPVGGFIMPADSTRQIGADNLAQLGFNKTVPANVSNGEYQLPPEQVHAIGMQTLDQMRNATHDFVPEKGLGFNPKEFAALKASQEPTENPTRGFKPKSQRNNDKPELYFANGTPGDDDDFNPIKGLYNANVGAAKGLVGGLLVPFGAAADSLRAAGRHAAGAETDPNTKLRYTEANAQNSNEGFEQMQRGMRQFAGLKKAPDPQPAAIQPKPATAALPAGTAAQATNTTPNPLTPTTAPQDQGAATNNSVPPPTGQPLANNVIRDGDSFSGSNIGAGYTINGKPSGLGNPQATSAQNQAAVQNLMDRTPEFGKGFYANAGQDFQAARQAAAVNAAQQLQGRQYEDRQRIENDLRMAKSAMPVGGARGQTKTQQENISNLQGQLAGVGNQQYDQFKTDATNNAALQKQLLGDQAATARTAMTEAGANSRNASDNSTERDKFLTSNDLENRKFGSEQQLRNFEVAKQQRQQKLYEQYDNATTPQEKSLAAQQIQELSGKGDSWKGIALQGGVDANGVKTDSVLAAVNERTGEMKRMDGGQSNPYQDGQELQGKDGKVYVVKNGVPVLKS